jgi:hypothetical protein
LFRVQGLNWGTVRKQMAKSTDTKNPRISIGRVSSSPWKVLANVDLAALSKLGTTNAIRKKDQEISLSFHQQL